MSKEDIPRNIMLDSLHIELLELLDQIDVQDDPSLTKQRFSIVEKYGHQVEFFTGPTHVIGK